MAQIDSACSWRTSSYTTQGADCVEIGTMEGVVAVRDSKDRSGPALVFTPAEMSRFVKRVKASVA